MKQNVSTRSSTNSYRARIALLYGYEIVAGSPDFRTGTPQFKN
jgi:hypothetical protein